MRKLVRTTSTIVRLRKLSKPPGFDRPTAIEKCPGDAVHSVHDPVIGSEDDRVRRIHLANEAEVLYDLPNRGPLPLIEPILGVDLREVIKRDLLYRQMSNPSYQVVNVPRIHPALARPEVVLLPHRLSLAQNIDAAGTPDAPPPRPIRRSALQAGI